LAARNVDVLVVAAVATAVIAVLAIATLRAPSERVFGMEIVGRHHDPFTVMAQFDGAPRPAMFWQPVTDVPGSVIARVTGGVAAYNWIVLLSFPLAAAGAFLLARHLSLSVAGATLAAMAFAFSPFHLAQAAYHPHVAQVQWVPVYLLALWRCLERPSRSAAVLLIAAAAAVTLSNFYGGLIAAVITPVAVLAHIALYQRSPRIWRNAALTVAILAGAAAAGVTYALAFAPAVLVDRAAFAFPLADISRYSAAALAFVVPPVAHPVLGDLARRFWSAAGVRDALLEQQLFLGWSLLALGLVAVGGWLTRANGVAVVPLLVCVGVAALYFALSPPHWLSHALPMFRSYARFGMLVQLIAALVAGIGFDVLWRTPRRYAKACAVGLVILLAGESAVSPSAISRDVLPTLAHRWIAGQAGAVRALDCVALTAESQSVTWLSHDRIVISGTDMDCSEPEFARKLAAGGFTHLLVRRAPVARAEFAAMAPMPGTHVVARFVDSEALEISASMPAIYTSALAGFSPREHDAAWSWRWMNVTALWVVRNTTAAPVPASLAVELSAFSRSRQLEVRIDDVPVTTIEVDPERRLFQLGPLQLTPGNHALTFRAVESPAVADTLIHNGDRRALSVAIGAWHWNDGAGR
jgi:hypothetical protein